MKFCLPDQIVPGAELAKTRTCPSGSKLYAASSPQSLFAVDSIPARQIQVIGREKMPGPLSANTTQQAEFRELVPDREVLHQVFV